MGLSGGLMLVLAENDEIGVSRAVADALDDVTSDFGPGGVVWIAFGFLAKSNGGATRIDDDLPRRVYETFCDLAWFVPVGNSGRRAYMQSSEPRAEVRGKLNGEAHTATPRIAAVDMHQ